MNDPILTPYDGFKDFYKEKHDENVNKFFDALAKEAKTDIEGNRETIKNLHKEEDNLSAVNKKIKGKKALIVLMIVAIIVLFIVDIVLMINIYGTLLALVPILTLVGLVGVLVLFIFLIKKLKGQIKYLKEDKSKIETKIKELNRTAWDQMSSLNQLFDWNMPAKVMDKTLPLIELDKNFDPAKYMYLHDKYGFGENEDPKSSTLFVQSGSILGNPFLIEKTRNQKMVMKRYTGSIVIHWTVTVTDSNGRSHIEHRSQTLYAHVDKPAPAYYNNTRLIYGNPAAPDLSFSRVPSGMSGKTEKEIERYVNKKVKKLDKLARKAVIGQSNYTRLGNDKFEVLFGATDRNNEVQFRLLFTPLAQTNLTKLIINNIPYGDDFEMVKDKCLNYVRSGHSQDFNYNVSPNYFIFNDFDKAKKQFVDYNNAYFKSLYFDLAPLLSIPLYQQTKTQEYIYKNNYASNVTKYEHEVMANALDVSLLRHPDTRSGVILKTEFKNKCGKGDNVLVHAYSFTAIERVDYVSVMGGDGRMHSVPVHWLEYIPVSNDSLMGVSEYNTTNTEFMAYSYSDEFRKILSSISNGNNFNYQRGLLSILLLHEMRMDQVESINESINQVLESSGFMDILNKLNEETIEKVEEKVNQALEKERQEENGEPQQDEIVGEEIEEKSDAVEEDEDEE